MIEHMRWFNVLVEEVFESKIIMRRVLTLKQCMYNSWNAYARAMNLSFKEARSFWN